MDDHVLNFSRVAPLIYGAASLSMQVMDYAT
jgi:hypothetical protein